MTKETDSREIALDILMEILEKSGYSHVILRQALNKYQYLEKSERAFISRLVEGTLEYLLQIDYVIDSFSSTKVKKMKPVIRTILRLSVYQLLYMDRVPDSAVCNEAVKLAVKRKFTGLKGFVNGVLRNVSRKKETLTWPNTSIKYSMPEWIVTMWEKEYGKDVSATMMESFLKNKKTTVRFNYANGTKEEILKSLEEQGVVVTESGIFEGVLYLDKYDYLDSLEAFRKGLIQVQDLSSVFVGEAADPKPEDYVIDVCGAPGGKSIHIADKLHGTGLVEVRDLNTYKVELIQQNIDRCGFSNLRTKVQDALVLDQESIEKADIVIADLPCSGLGIMGRKPDIKNRLKPEDLNALTSLQRDILTIVQSYVKPGGKLVFSTCTVNKQENEENARWFLEQFSFDPLDLTGKLGTEITSETLKQGYIQLLPGIHPCDGFFLSAFIKR